jgi:phosphonate transport system permease protein
VTAQDSDWAQTPGPAPTRPSRPRTAWKGWLSLAVVAAITYWAGSARWGIGIDLSALVRNFSHGFDKFVQLLQPSFKHVGETLEPMLQSLETALVSTVVGCAVGLPLAFAASRVTMPNRWIRGPVRAVLSVIRSIPDILYASILATILGVGPLPGVVALVLFSVGILVKLLAEVIDAVDTGPFEAALSTGATRGRAGRAAVLPQILPNYTAFSLYVLELNIRTGTVLGLVGAGGIGQLLNDWRIYYRYHDVSLIILEILVVVLVLEAISATLRRRLS